MGFPDRAVSEIISHLFGVKIGPTFHEGLVDCKSESEFDAKLLLLEKNWEEFESIRAKKAGKQLSFHAWFVKYHSDEMKKTMIYPIRVAAGLGDPPSEFCTNDSESINSSLKQFLGFKKSDWPIFNTKMRKFVDEQLEETCKPLLGCGQYKLCDEYRHLAVAPSRWFTALTDKQKEDMKRKFQRCPVATNSTMAEFLEDGSNNAIELSVNIELAVEVTGLPTLVVQQIWAKAVELLSSKGHVAQAPGSCSMSRMVASSSQKRPHFICRSSDGRFECDKDCQGFAQRYICAHSVAAAEDNGMLKNFIENYAKFSKTPKGSSSVAPNFTRLSMSNLPRGIAGHKGEKAAKKKAVSRRKTVATQHRQPLQLRSDDEGSGSSCTAPPFVNVNSNTGTSSVTVITSSSGNYSLNSSPIYSQHQPPYQSYYGNYYPPVKYAYPPYYQNPFPSNESFFATPPQQHRYFATPPQQHHDFATSPSQSGESYATPSQCSGENHDSSRSFFVKFLNGRIKVCAGCKGPQIKGVHNEVLPPPHDICIVHSEPLTFINPRTGLEASKVGNAHYHVNYACIRKKHPNFTARCVSCPEGVMELMQPCHLKLLSETLGFTP